jgi:hypothetical protein
LHVAENTTITDADSSPTLDQHIGVRIPGGQPKSFRIVLAAVKLADVVIRGQQFNR